MSYVFTKLSDVPVVAEFPEGANAVIETNGEIKRCPSSDGGGGNGGFDFVITMDATDGSYSLASGSYSAIKEKLLAPQPVLGVSHIVAPGEVAQTRVMGEVYYVYAGEYIHCEEAATGGSKWKIYPDNTVESI